MPAGTRFIVATPPDATPAYLALLAAKLTAEKNVTALLVSRETGHVVAARSPELSQDLGAILRESLKEFPRQRRRRKTFRPRQPPRNPTQADAFITLTKSRLVNS